MAEYPPALQSFLNDPSHHKVTIIRTDEGSTFATGAPPEICRSMPMDLYIELSDFVQRNRKIAENFQEIHWPGHLSYVTTHRQATKTVENGTTNEFVVWRPPSISEMAGRARASTLDSSDYLLIKSKIGREKTDLLRLAGIDPVKALSTMKGLSIYSTNWQLCMSFAFAGWVGLRINGLDYFVCGMCFNGLQANAGLTGSREDMDPARCLFWHHMLCSNNCWGDIDGDNEKILDQKAGFNMQKSDRLKVEAIRIHPDEVISYLKSEDNSQRLRGLMSENGLSSATALNLSLEDVEKIMGKYTSGILSNFRSSRYRALSKAMGQYGLGDIANHKSSYVAREVGKFTIINDGRCYPGYIPDGLDESGTGGNDREPKVDFKFKALF